MLLQMIRHSVLPMSIMCLIVCATAAGQEYLYEVWVASYEQAKVNAMEVDDTGSIYIVGQCNGDLFVARYSSDGHFIWDSFYNGTKNGLDEGCDLIVDEEGNVTVTGMCEENDSGRDIITIQFDCHGNEKWKAMYHSYSDKPDRGTSVSADASGNIYVAGDSYDSYNQSWKQNIVIIKYDSTGQMIWSNQYNHLEIDPYYGPQPVSLITDYACQIHIRSEAAYILGVSQTGRHTGVLMKYKTSGYGQRVWYKQIDGIATMTDMVIDEDGSIFLSGFGSYESGVSDYVVAKYDTAGNEYWIRNRSGSLMLDDECYSIDVDDNGAAYVTGYTINNNDVSDITTVKYDSDGTRLWVMTFTGNSHVTWWDNFGKKVICGTDGSVCVAGRVRNQETGYDAAVITYDTSGRQKMSTTFNYHQNSDEEIVDMSVLGECVYVTCNSDNDIVIVKYSQEATAVEDRGQKHSGFVLYQNYPNPFNPTTSIQYSVVSDRTPHHSPLVTLKIYNVLGQEVRTLVNGTKEAGYYSETWDGRSAAGEEVSSGIYIYQLRVGDVVVERRMALVR
jgi:hypothetical protein